MKEVKLLNFIYPDREFDLVQYSKDSSRVEDPFNVRNNRSIGWLLKQINFPYTMNFFSEGISQDTKYYLPINFGNHGWDFLEHFNDWNIIRENKNIFLLIYYAPESIVWEYYITPTQWFFKLKNYLDKGNIPYNKVKFICGDIDAKNNSKKSEGFLSEIDFLGINIFELVHWSDHEVRYLNKDVLDKKEFLCLNFLMRDNRKYMLYYLKKYDVFKNGMISAVKWDQNNPTEIAHDTFNIDNTKYQDVLNHLKTEESLEIFAEGQGNRIHQSYYEYYRNTKYSLVTETFVGERAGKFITEKTYKPISMGHPFIIFGPTGILKQLKEDGYETFPELFDESYDNYTSPAKQLEIILNNLKEPKIITEKILEKCQRNKEHFFKQSSKEKLKKILTDFV